MKRIVGLLVVLALVLSLSATVFAAPAASKSVASATNASVGEVETEIQYKPSEDGVLTITISGNPGYHFDVINAKTEGSIGLPVYGDAEGTYTFDLVAATRYKVRIWGYNKALWSDADATVNYNITFTPAVIEVEPIEIDKSEVDLVLGENNVALLENTIVSLYAFTPEEPGVYTFTAEGAEIATYGFSAWNQLDVGVNGVLEHTATAAEQTVLLGVSAATPNVNIKVEKTGDYTPPVQIEYEDYEPVDTPLTEFVELEEEDVEEIDITQEQNVVLGDDGYYHLGTANGPVVYVNLNTDQFMLAMLYSAGAPIHMHGVYTDENGDPHHYNFINMITNQYYNYSQEYDYHPLNTDLMIFLKAYGTSQGWYNAEYSAFASITSGDFVEESAWLAPCVIVPNAAPEIPEPTNPTNPTVPSTPATEPSAPATEPSAPATEPSAPATEPSAPAAEPSAPAAEPSAPATEPSAPAAEPSTPVTESTAPATPGESTTPTESTTPAEPEVKDPADSFDRDSAGNFVIESLEEGVDIFGTGDDISYVYTAETNGTIVITSAAAGNEEAGCRVKINNGEWITSGSVAVSAGDVVIIEIWGNYKGTVSLNVASGDNGNAGGNTEDLPETGDVGVVGALVAMAFSTVGGLVITKKKEF